MGDQEHDSTETGPCQVCTNESSKRCIRCMQAYYCSKEHQQGHWKKHKIDCHPVKIISDNSGRKMLVATRDIPKGEIIIKESPLTSGPRAQGQRPDRFPLCLECYRIVRGNYRCTKCFWPLCGPICQMGKHHSNFECSIFAQNSVSCASNYQEYLGVCIIRGLMLKEIAPEKWTKLMELESRTDQLGEFEITFLPVLEFIRDECHQLQYDVETIKFVAGALQVNRMSDENDDDAHDPFGSFLYYKTNFASHSCVPNSMWFIQTSSDVYLRASVSIKKGELVTTTNVPMEEATQSRRTNLDFFGISCNCKRCTDPTELGTYMAAVKCQNRDCTDDDGYYLAQNPLDANSNWICTNSSCGSTKSMAEIQSVVNTIKDEYNAIKHTWESQTNRTDLKSHLERIKKTEYFLKKYQGKILHKNHSILFVCKKDLCYRIPQIAPHMENDTQRMELEEKQVGWAKECLELADKFWPGYSRYRGQLLYNLQRGLFCLIFSEVELLGKSRRSPAYNTERGLRLREAFQELLLFRAEVKTILSIESDVKMEKQLALEMDNEGVDFQMIRRVLQI